MDYSNQLLNERRMRRMYKSALKKTKNKIAVIIMRVMLILAMMAAAGAVAMLLGAYLSIIDRAPNITKIFDDIDLDDNYNSVIVNWRGEELIRLEGGENREYAPSSMIPDHMKLAIVAIEDARFFEHDGIDFRSMGRALWVTVTGGTEGASTITQQVIKMMLGHRRNTFETKLQEQVLAIDMEQELIAKLGSKAAAKDYILEIYMNSVHLAHGADGVQAAALLYFGKNVWELTLSESTVIAAITSNPVRFSPIRNPQNNAVRRQIVLDNMLSFGFITRAEYDEALADDVYERVALVAQIASEQNSAHSYFTDELIRQVRADLMREYNLTSQQATNWIYNKGLTIVSTMDERIQSIVDAAYLNDALFPSREYEVEVEIIASIRNDNTGLTRRVSNTTSKGIVSSLAEVDAHVERYLDRVLREGDRLVAPPLVIPVIQPQSAFVVMDHATGHVVAFAGGRGEKRLDMGLNRAVRSTRQPGSTFKTFVFAAGIDSGILTAATVFDDVPRIHTHDDGRIEEWPRNWYTGGYRGLNSVRRAMIDSMNVITVKALEMVGIQNALDYLDGFGFTSLVNDDKNLSAIALGGMTHGVSPLELTAAYAAIANQGMYNKPIFYTRVMNHNGDIILDNTIHEPERIMRPTTAFIMTDIMADVMRHGTGSRARLGNGVTMAAAGKTGTTSRTRDQWYAGYTPYYAASVWVGYDKPREFSSATRNEAVHLGLWRTIMEEIHRGLPQRDFIRPPGVERHSVCNMSGLLPIPGLCDEAWRGSQVRQEFFEVGTEPQAYCDVHAAFEICVGIAGETPWALPTQNCPWDHLDTVIGIIRTVPYFGDSSVRDQYEKPRHYCAVHNHYGTQPVTIYTPSYDDGHDHIFMDEPDEGNVFENIFGPAPTDTPGGIQYYTGDPED
ncbi:MAG: transglycosylase domain-containing protein [Defluviitaleaceae bacterium]|nr:transglycosylase domain-containing protein [Defluviitaleaceae bacterium]MCL2835389.1 transglycosylase domain-containing protein [Defluviitaleaceae bacterium]